MNRDSILQLILKINDALTENKEYLTELDAAIGDADHGINMCKGFRAACDKLAQTQPQTINDVLKTTAMALISNVGGASGPLYGTFFLKAAAYAAGKEELGLVDFGGILRDGVEGIKQRGKAELGEKTMLDVLIPVEESIRKSAEEGLAPKASLEKACAVARERIEFTKTIAATKGRASYLGERSIGHQDPGATSSYLMLNCLYESL